MNRTISSRLAIGLLIAIVIVFSVYLWIENKSLKYSALKTQAIQESPKITCKNRAFQGNAVIKVWQIKKGTETILKIASDDLTKMPSKNITELKLIDSNSQLSKTLANSSPTKPVEITLTGVAIPCHGTALACLNYKDGIFRSFL